MKKLIVFSCEIRSRVKCGLHRGECWRLFTILWYNITKKKEEKTRTWNLSACFIQAHRSVCINVSGKRGEKKKISASLTQMFVFSKIFFFFFFYWKVAGVSSFFFFDIIAMEVIIKWEDDSDSSLPASQSGIIERVVVRRHHIRYLAAISPRRWPFFSHIFFLPLFLIK